MLLRASKFGTAKMVCCFEMCQVRTLGSTFNFAVDGTYLCIYIWYTYVYIDILTYILTS